MKLQADSKSSHTPFTKGGRGLIGSKSGFTLIELMITMVIFVLVIAAGSQIFTGLLTQFKQQSKISETNIEGLVGLEILRQDIARGGYGLPWNLGGATYNEVVVESVTPWVDRDFNDGPPDNPTRGTDPAGASNPPGGIRSGNGYALNGSDVLVIKAINVARSNTSQRWTTLSSVAPNVRTWSPASENLVSADHVIVISPGATETNSRRLVVDTSSSPPGFSTTYGNVASTPWTNVTETRIVYGVDPASTLRMPFNRADYYVRIPATMPQRCATNTGILYKATINHADGRVNELPLVDCIANMQVVFGLDNDSDGDFEPGVSADGYSDDISAFTAQEIRNRVRQVRVYIVAQEGQMDRTYTFNNFTGTCSTCIRVGDGVWGTDFNLSTISPGSTRYLNYRWKLYTIVTNPNNLR